MESNETELFIIFASLMSLSRKQPFTCFLIAIIVLDLLLELCHPIIYSLHFNPHGPASSSL